MSESLRESNRPADAADFSAFAPGTIKAKGKSRKPKTAPSPKSTQKDPDGSLKKALTNCELSAMSAHALYGLLMEKKETMLAKLVWTVFLQSSTAAETLGDYLGLEVSVA